MKKQNILISSIVGFLLTTACKHEKAETFQSKEQPISVTTAMPTSANTSGLGISGQVEAVQTAAISTRIMGYITDIKVKEGDKVSAGQVLATINSSDILAKKAQVDAQIAEATAHVKSAQKDYDRFNALFNQQSASQKEVDNIQLQLQASKARLEAALQMKNEVNAQLQYTVLTAPFNGTVIQKMVDKGSMASPGMPVVVIEQAGAVQINASVPESAINTVTIGKKVMVQITSAQKTFEGIVSQINPSSKFSGGQYIIKITVPEKEQKGLYNGMFVHVLLPGVSATPTQGNILIPVEALVQKDQLEGIYTIGNNKTALLRWLRIGKKQNGMAEVLSGLNADEAFITTANGKLYNGAPVQVNSTK